MSEEKKVGIGAENAASGSGDTVFTVDSSYQGYVFLGWAAGFFETQRGEMQPYFTMYVLSPVSSYVSENYEAYGYKAEKKKCVSAEVWSGFNPGDRVKLFFDDKQRVQMAALDQ